MVLKQPIGPVAAFSPWNFPASIPARKLGALAAGCSLILKAAEETPATACAMVQCYADAGLPPGVLNLVFGDPSEISRHLIASPIIRAVTLTGSVPVGKKVAALAAAYMKPVVMELGGHAPVIICDDADATAVAKLAVMAKFRNAGQICTCPTRFIVHSARADDFLDAFAEGARALRIGAGDVPGVQMGPLANGRRVDEIDALVQDAIERGAKLVAGGQRIAGPGYFYEPTILSNIPAEARVLHEEPFGPVALVQTFNTLDDAIKMANALPFGLASYAFTRSAAVANTLVERVNAGLMSINHLGASQPEGPFGGVKDSGYGREGGTEGIDTFMVTKYVSQFFDAA
jgi:succinate-semialdehyde dehydrogenase/glutarate-semialdehyde dehydrogenase